MSSGAEIGRLLTIMLRKPQPPPKQKPFTPLASMRLEQLLADRPVHHLPHLLARGPEEGQVEGLVGGLEHAADGRRADRHDVDGAELRALEVRRLALGEAVADHHVELDPAPALLVEALGQVEEGVVHRVAGAHPAARLQLERGLGGRDHRGEKEHDERDEDLHGHTSL